MSKLETTNEFCFLYSTYSSVDAAVAAARTAVDKKLAACVNIYPLMKSIYVWEGKREETAEVAAFFKTRRSLVETLTAELWAEHSYSLPCFVVLPVEGANTDYIAWVREQTDRPLTA